MRKKLCAVAGVVCFTWGGVRLLFLLPVLVLLQPRLNGVDYLLGSLDVIPQPKALAATGAGLVFILTGIALGLWACFPDLAEVSLSRGKRLLLFWGLAFMGTAATFCLLVAITFLNLQLD